MCGLQVPASLNIEDDVHMIGVKWASLVLGFALLLDGN